MPNSNLDPLQDKPYLLHMLIPQDNISPFDANMAYDAGYHAVIPYVNVKLAGVRPLVQDAIFSRGPRGAWKTGIFIGGHDAWLALDMLKEAEKSMFDPFKVSLFADPSGAFSTCVSILIMLESHLARCFKETTAGQNICVFGTGPVGACVAIMCARLGARVTMIGYNDHQEAERARDEGKSRFGVDLAVKMAENDETRKDAIKGATAAIACSAAGCRVVSVDVINATPSLKVAIDINAVPPSGIENLGANDNEIDIPGLNHKVIGSGSLAIGGLKYLIQQRLLAKMMQSDYPVTLDLLSTYRQARKWFAPGYEMASLKPAASR